MPLNRLKRDLIVTTLIELLSKIPLYGFEFLLASWLTMNDYAEWAALVLIYRAAPYLHAGALSYLNKRYPILLGKGHSAAASRIESHINAMFNGMILLLFLLSLIFYLTHHFSLAAWFVILGVLVMQVFTYCQAKIRNEGDFLAYSIGLIIFSLLQFILAYVTVRRYGLLAAVTSTFISYLFAVFYYLIILRMDYHFRLPERRNVKRIIQLGSAPFLLTISSFLTQVSDRIALVLLDDKVKLAFYGFFALFFQIGIIAINALGKVLSPYIFHRSANNHVSQTIVISMATCYVMLTLFLVMNGFLILFGHWFIQTYFAKFNGGLLGVYNYATIGILLSLTLAFYPQLMIAGKEYMIVKFNFIYSSFSILVIYLLAKYWKGFEVYSFGSLLMNTCYCILLLMMIERIVLHKLYVVRLTIGLIFISSLVINYQWMYA